MTPTHSSTGGFIHQQLPQVPEEQVSFGLALCGLASEGSSALEWHFGRFGLSRSRFETLVCLWSALETLEPSAQGQALAAVELLSDVMRAAGRQLEGDA